MYGCVAEIRQPRTRINVADAAKRSGKMSAERLHVRHYSEEEKIEYDVMHGTCWSEWAQGMMKFYEMKPATETLQ